MEWPIQKDRDGNIIKDGEGNIIPVFMRPHGVEHHYAPLAIITVEQGSVALSASYPDCRSSFKTVVNNGDTIKELNQKIENLFNRLDKKT